MTELSPRDLVMDFFRRRTPSQGSLAADSKVKQTVEALQVLQKTLHELTPPEQAAVQDTLPFAAPEWLEGLALSIRSSSTGRGVVQKETSSAGTTVTTKEAGDDARMQLTTDAKKVVIVLVGVPARGKSLIGFVLPRTVPCPLPARLMPNPSCRPATSSSTFCAGADMSQSTSTSAATAVARTRLALTRLRAPRRVLNVFAARLEPRGQQKMPA